LKRVEVREHLRQLIDASQPGELLPSERTLSEQFGVSRPTLRAAIEDLARDGLLDRSQGRGTFTSRPKISQELTPRTADDFGVPSPEGDWSSQVEIFRTEPAGARLGRKMHVSPSTEVLYVARVRIVDDEPMGIEHIRIPAEIVPGIAPADFESGSLYRLLSADHRADRDRRARGRTTARADLLPRPAVRTHHPRRPPPRHRAHPLDLPRRPLPHHHPPQIRPRLRLRA
jgi:GntR family transcriptional regulator